MRMLQKGLSNPKTQARWPGFTGYAGNYDTDGVQYSFIYPVFYYLTRGDDLSTGNCLLQRKYN